MKVSCTTKETRKRDKFLLPYLRKLFIIDQGKGLVRSKYSGKLVGKPRNKNSYGGIGLKINGKCYFINTHRVIWLVSKGLVPVGYVINHKNGVKSISKISNLECISAGNNQKHAYRNKLRNISNNPGSNNGNALFTNKQVSKIRKLFIGKKKSRNNFYKVAKFYGVSTNTIRSMVNNQTYKT